jgi:hypothetical protein
MSGLGINNTDGGAQFVYVDHQQLQISRCLTSVASSGR